MLHFLGFHALFNWLKTETDGSWDLKLGRCRISCHAVDQTRAVFAGARSRLDSRCRYYKSRKNHCGDQCGSQESYSFAALQGVRCKDARQTGQFSGGRPLLQRAVAERADGQQGRAAACCLLVRHLVSCQSSALQVAHDAVQGRAVSAISAHQVSDFPCAGTNVRWTTGALSCVHDRRIVRSSD